jgi:hypothetical protein
LSVDQDAAHHVTVGGVVGLSAALAVRSPSTKEPCAR